MNKAVAESAPVKKAAHGLPTVKSNRKPTVKDYKKLPPLSSEEKMAILLRPHASMEALFRGESVGTDWYNVTFRIACIHESVKQTHDELSQGHTRIALDTMLAMYHNYDANGGYIFENLEDLCHVSEVLTEGDKLLTTETRVSLIFSFKKARTFVVKFAEDNRIPLIGAEQGT